MSEYWDLRLLPDDATQAAIEEAMVSARATVRLLGHWTDPTDNHYQPPLEFLQAVAALAERTARFTRCAMGVSP